MTSTTTPWTRAARRAVATLTSAPTRLGWAGAVAAAILLSAACRQASRVARTDAYGITLHLTGDVPHDTYFQSHTVMVTRIAEIGDETEDGRQVTVVYPSVNVGGPGPQFSHLVTVREPDGVPIRLDTLAALTTWIVLERAEGSDVYELVGSVDLPAAQGLVDFFQDKPEYRRTARD